MRNKRPYDKVKIPASKKQKLIDVELLGSDLTVLGRFVQLLEAGELDDDYVQDALHSKNIHSVLTYLDTGNLRKSSELATVFKALYMLILIGSREKSIELTAVVHGLAEGVLEDLRFASCIRGLRQNQGAETNKAVLRLLAVVSTVSTNLARGLLRALPFSGQEFTQCSRRRNTTDAQDVRSCFLNLIAAFVFSGNDLVIREAVDKRIPFTMAINESYIDKYANVMLILEMLLKIAENKTISKTQKVRLFDRICLKQLLYLYTWRGEALTLQDLAGRDEDDVDPNQLDCIRQKLHQILILLTTSTRSGLVFTGRNRDWKSPANDLILHALICPPMSAAHTDPLRSELVVSALFTSPDILAPYLDHVSPFLHPRADSSKWFSLMRLICEIYDRCRVNLIKWVMMALERCTSPQQASQVILDCSFLSPKMVAPLSSALQFKESTEVVAAAEELMDKIRINLIILLTWLATTQHFPTSAYKPAALKMELRLLLPERLPTTESVHRFSALFDQEFRDTQVLHDQTFLTQPEAQKPITELESNEDSKPARIAEDDLNQLQQLPEELRKPFERLYKSLIGIEVSISRLQKAISKLPNVLEYCIQEHFHMGVMLRCLSQAVRLQQQEPFTHCGIKPKRLLKLLIAHPQFASVLHPDWLTPPVPTDLAESAPSKQPLTSNSDRQYVLDSLIELLSVLVRCCPKLGVKHLHPLWFLRSYTATLAPKDRHILEILFLMESQLPGLLTNVRNTTPIPVIWGPILSRHYRFPEDKPGTSLVQPVLFHQPNISALYHCIDADLLRLHSTQFPLNRKWLTQSSPLDSQSVRSNPSSDNRLYDPCFLLLVFHHYLELYRTSFVDGGVSSQTDQFLRSFYSHHCLDFAVAALSSYSKHMRGMARSVIADFRDLAEHWKPSRAVKSTDGQTSLSLQLFPERSKIIFILDTLRNSLSAGGGSMLGGASRRNSMFSSKADTGGRLTRVHANFFVLALQLLSKPEHLMYRSLWNCLLSKPAIDLNHVPDFLRAFFSTDTHFRAERHWISRLCASSLADGADYLVLERSRVFKHMLATFSSPSSDATFQLTVLQLLCSATSQPRLMHALIRFHALPLWLWRHALQPCPQPQVELFRAILNNMLTAFAAKETDSPVLELLQLLKSEFDLVQTQNTNPGGQLLLVNGM